MALHPQVQVVVDEFNAIEAPPIAERPLAEVREGFHDFVMSLQAPGETVGRVEDRDIPGPKTGRSASASTGPRGRTRPRRCRSTSTTTAAATWCLASTPTTTSAARSARAPAASSSASTTARRRRTSSPGPARTPGPPSPGWRRTRPGSAPIPRASPWAAYSAGGCLAAVTAQRAKQEGDPPLVFQLLVYPVTDTDETRESHKTFADGYVLNAEAMTWFFDCYFNDDSERSDVRAAPLRVDDLSGLPPALVMTASHDPLRDDGRLYAEKLAAAGVPTDHRNYEGHIHGFWTATGSFDVASEAHATVGAALRRAFGTGG